MSKQQRDFAGLVTEIRERLQGACSHMSEQEFNALLTDIATMALRFDAIDERPFGEARRRLDGLALPRPAPSQGTR